VRTLAGFLRSAEWIPAARAVDEPSARDLSDAALDSVIRSNGCAVLALFVYLSDLSRARSSEGSLLLDPCHLFTLPFSSALGFSVCPFLAIAFVFLFSQSLPHHLELLHWFG
jgi:hypothetical protein